MGDNLIRLSYQEIQKEFCITVVDIIEKNDEAVPNHYILRYKSTKYKSSENKTGKREEVRISCPFKDERISWLYVNGKLSEESPKKTLPQNLELKLEKLPKYILKTMGRQ